MQLMNMMTSMYKNRPYDEAILAGDDEEMESNNINSRQPRKATDHPGMFIMDYCSLKVPL